MHLKKLLSQLVLPYGAVWCGMCNEDVVGPIFFDGNINGENYRQLLEAHALPFINRQFEEMVFQQDGARNLNEKLDGRWIGRRDRVEWPARSPDLASLHFSSWVVMKHSLCTKNKGHLKESIKR